MGIGNSTGGLFGNSPPDIVTYTLEGTGLASLQNLGGAQPSALSQGANVNDECWFAGSSVWGVSATYPWQGGVQKGGATVELGPGYLFTPAYVPPEALSGG